MQLPVAAYVTTCDKDHCGHNPKREGPDAWYSVIAHYCIGER